MHPGKTRLLPIFLPPRERLPREVFQWPPNGLPLSLPPRRPSKLYNCPDSDAAGGRLQRRVGRGCTIHVMVMGFVAYTQQRLRFI
jgi:hypothetical protein